MIVKSCTSRDAASIPQKSKTFAMEGLHQIGEFDQSKHTVAVSGPCLQILDFFANGKRLVAMSMVTVATQFSLMGDGSLAFGSSM